MATSTKISEMVELPLPKKAASHQVGPASEVPKPTPKVKRAALAKCSMRWTAQLAKVYGRAVLLPGESESAYSFLFDELSFTQDLRRDRFEPYLFKEMVDAAFQVRRWRGATAALINRHMRDLQQASPRELERSSSANVAIPPMADAEREAVLAHFGLDHSFKSALSLVQLHDLRAEFAARGEAAEERFQRAHDLIHELREARAHLASARSHVAYVAARIPADRYGESMDSQLRDPTRKQYGWYAQSLAAPDKGFTPLGQSILGPTALLEGESHFEYANLFLAIGNRLDSGKHWDCFLINDAAMATWEMRRLREAGEVLINCYFRLKAMAMLGQRDTTSEQHSLLGLPAEELITALRLAGISTNEVSAMTLKESIGLAKMIDDEYLRLENKRRRTLKQLIKIQARSICTSYHQKRETEFFRKRG